MHPLHRETRNGFRRVKKNHVICAIWLLGSALSLPEYLLYHVEPFCYNGKLYYSCQVSGSEETQMLYTIL